MEIGIRFGYLYSSTMDMNYWGFIYEIDGETYSGIATCPTPKETYHFEELVDEQKWDTEETPISFIAREMALFIFRHDDPESLQHPERIQFAREGIQEKLEGIAK